MGRRAKILLTHYQKEKADKHEKIYNEYMAELVKGSSKIATQEYLAKKYGYRTTSGVMAAVRFYLKKHPDARDPRTKYAPRAAAE